MVAEAPKTIYRKDYKPTPYGIDKVELQFDLGEGTTIVSSTLFVKPSAGTPAGTPLEFVGEELEFVAAELDGVALDASSFEATASKFILLAPPADAFTLRITTRVYPEKNTALEGLYKSSGNFCTQCEAEGYRRITYYYDRPDVLAKFTTKVIGDKSKYPVLLSNGNLVESGDLDSGKHFAVWEDPFPKPCYLFALVAGNLAHIEDSFTTCSGKKVQLRIYVEEHNINKCDYAMESLKASMKWDEDVFGLEYDLDLFNIVAVDDFNMGAMENKSLNIFNSRLVLATPETATDMDYSAIEGVVAHEYFHNWTGNRVTCRDWFQLSLKEGLTVFRDQEFSSDMNSRGVERIRDVVRLRASQFSQDAGPMAHPVRPDSYIKMDNFYTVTVYEKGAEVVRMYNTLLGTEGFRKGMDLYFERHDGGAVTCDDFRQAMADANNTELTQFERWYSQSGTPVLKIRGAYDADAGEYTLACEQSCPPTPGQESKEPFLLPVKMGLIGRDGKELPLKLKGSEESVDGSLVLRMTEKEQSFVFTGVPEEPVPSLLRGFSCPVRLDAGLSQEQLLFLLANDTDDFVRWEAMQTINRELMLSLLPKQLAGEALEMDQALVGALRSVLTDETADPAFLSLLLALPGESEISDLVEAADPEAIHEVHEFVSKGLAAALEEELKAKFEQTAAPAGEKYSPDPASKARRSLHNRCLMYLAKLKRDDTTALCVKCYKEATNMTDKIAALVGVAGIDGPEKKELLADFYEEWKDDPLVVNKWLSLQASSNVPGNVENMKALLEHPAYDITNPNKNYALLGGFCSSSVNFHAKDGSGYKFLADMVLKLDKLNAQVAARMVSAFTRWKKYEPVRQALMKAEISRIMAEEGLTANTYEIVSKSLE